MSQFCEFQVASLLSRVLQGVASTRRAAPRARQVSYLELYREHIRDLLLASEGDHPEELKVVEHPKLGVYARGVERSAEGL